MKKTRRILALAGIIIIVGLYIVTLILAIVNNEFTQRWFTAAIVSTIIIPILIYVYQWIYKLVKKDAEESKTRNYINDDQNQ